VTGGGFDQGWLTVIGLAIDIVAVLLIAWDFVIVPKPSEPPAQPYGRPPRSGREFVNRLRDERRTILCVGLLVFGFLLQIAGSWPT